MSAPYVPSSTTTLFDPSAEASQTWQGNCPSWRTTATT
jgi:hypothetical protein